MDEAERRALEAREARRTARFKFALIVLVMAVMMDAAVAIAMLRGMAPPAPVTIVVLGVVTVGLAVLAAAFAPGGEARRLAASPGRRDREQRARTAQMLVVSAMSAVIALIAVLRGGDIVAGDPEFSAVMVIIVFATLTLTLPAMVMNWDGGAQRARRYLEDELTRAFRARAIATGFWVLLPGVLGIYLTGLWRPEQAVIFMPLVLWAGAAAACLRFALLHRAAERDE